MLKPQKQGKNEIASKVISTTTVKWFNEIKGFDFINELGPDIFAHFSSAQGAGYKTLPDAQKVTFTVTDDENGVHTEEVKLENEDKKD